MLLPVLAAVCGVVGFFGFIFCGINLSRAFQYWVQIGELEQILFRSDVVEYSVTNGILAGVSLILIVLAFVFGIKASRKKKNPTGEAPQENGSQ